MPKFRKKPVVIEARQYDGRATTGIELINWMGNGPSLLLDLTINIPTLEGDMLASSGDWIIKGVQGEFYPCKPDIFEKTYESTDIRQFTLHTDQGVDMGSDPCWLLAKRDGDMIYVIDCGVGLSARLDCGSTIPPSDSPDQNSEATEN